MSVRITLYPLRYSTRPSERSLVPGSQIILYFTGGALSYIAATINTAIPNWLLTANTLAVTAICPFVGFLTDLLGMSSIS